MLGGEDVGLNFIPCRFGKLTLAMLLVESTNIFTGVGAAPKWRGPGPHLRTLAATGFSPEPIEETFHPMGIAGRDGLVQQGLPDPPGQGIDPQQPAMPRGVTVNLLIVRHCRGNLAVEPTP